MKKQEIKNKIREAVENGPFKDDIQKVSIFGSYVNGVPRSNSDVDILIEFTPAAKVGFFRYFSIQEDIEKHLGKKIDLLTPEALSKYFRSDVLKQAELIYEK